MFCFEVWVILVCAGCDSFGLICVWIWCCGGAFSLGIYIVLIVLPVVMCVLFAYFGLGCPCVPALGFGDVYVTDYVNCGLRAFNLAGITTLCSGFWLFVAVALFLILDCFF